MSSGRTVEELGSNPQVDTNPLANLGASSHNYEENTPPKKKLEHSVGSEVSENKDDPFFRLSQINSRELEISRSRMT